jgi:large subunit ribosomal protein L7e
VKHLRKKFALKTLIRQGGSSSRRRQKHYLKECRQVYRTEIWMARMAWKAANF